MVPPWALRIQVGIKVNVKIELLIENGNPTVWNPYSVTVTDRGRSGVNLCRDGAPTISAFFDVDVVRKMSVLGHALDVR